MSDLKRILTLECLSNKDEDEDKNWLIFPITPFPKFTESVSYDTVNIYGNGEMVTGHNLQLTRCSIDGIFPGYYARESNANKLKLLPDKDGIVHGAKHYSKKLSKWLRKQNNLHLTYGTATETINSLRCRIESFEYGEEDGSMSGHFNLNLIQYRNNEIEDNSIAVNIDKVVKEYGSSVYYTEEGDTLITIAGKILNDSSQWYYLQNINNLENPLKVFSSGERIILKR